MAQTEYWANRFNRLKIERMEDEEFMSELFFLTAANDFFDSSPGEIDKLYEDYSEKEETEINAIKDQFKINTEFIQKLCIDYNKLKKLNWTTHLYGLYSVAWHCTRNNINPKDIKKPLLELYGEYFSRGNTEYEGALLEYKNSCSSRTRSKDQRKKRLDAILSYCKII